LKEDYNEDQNTEQSVRKNKLLTDDVQFLLNLSKTEINEKK
jgi:hypothetical protein